MKKRWLAIVTALAIISTFVGCAQTGAAPAETAVSETVETTETTEAPAAEEVPAVTEASEAAYSEEEADDIVLAHFMFFDNAAEDTQRVEDAINAISVPEIGVRVHIKSFTAGNWTTQIGLMLAAGDQLDLVPTYFNGPTSFANMRATGQLQPLNDLLEEYGQGILEIMPEKYLESTTFDGNIYSVPSYKDNVSKKYFIARTDILRDLGLEEEFANIKSTDDIEALTAKVVEATGLPLGGGTIGVMAGNLYVGDFADNVYSETFVGNAVGALSTDYSKVVSYYETEEFAEVCRLVHDWYEKGYVYKDMATDTMTNNTDHVKDGIAFGFVNNAETSTAMSTINNCGYEMSSVTIGTSPLATSNVNTIGWTIPSNAQEPEAAMKFMNMLYTDSRIINLFNFGEEGIDYIVKEDGTFDFVEGQDMGNHKYHVDLTWLFGNQFICGIWRDVPTLREEAKAVNDAAVYSDNFGFSADSTGLDTQIAGINSAVTEFVTGLVCGSSDPETEIPKFSEKLKAAGIDEVISTIQGQLDDWRASN